MSSMTIPSIRARWQDNRSIVRRLVAVGKLELLTPARFGGGEGAGVSGETADMPLARQPVSGRPLLTGTSIAGAARTYLREWESGYAVVETNASLAFELFGAVDDIAKESRESWLVIDDALASQSASEIRPGVAIDAKTRIARRDAVSGRGFLYDLELLQAGTEFTLRFELSLPDNPALQDKLLQGLALVLGGFQSGEIGMGARKRRGLGECRVAAWDIQEYDLRQPADLLVWLDRQPGRALSIPAGAAAQALAAALKTTVPADRRRCFSMRASFKLDSSLLIRSGGEGAGAPDTAHLKSMRIAGLKPVLTGTSLAGALRSRALRIARARGHSGQAAAELVAAMFGPEKIEQGAGKPKWASKAVVHEREIVGAYERVQSRVKIDRFTGGSFPGALFDQQPLFGRTHSRTTLEMQIELRDPQNEEIALLLYLLKDLWTGDLPLGGEASVGRGRLKGLRADLKFTSPVAGESGSWTITPDPQDENKLVLPVDFARLEAYANINNGGAA